MGKISIILILFLFQSGYAQYKNPPEQGGVGIGTSDPKQKLHIASSAGTLRVESLNSTNNSFNGGGTINYPLYVDENGDFTLFFKPLINTEDLDAFNHATLPNSSVSLSTDDVDGINTTIIDSREIVVSRASILELKYNLSYDVYLNDSEDIIDDGLARRIETYVTVNVPLGQSTDSRLYGPTSKVYTSSNVNSVAGTFYNSCTTYITLPAAGTYTIEFIGAVSSDINVNSQPVTISRSTHVKFAVGDDFLFARLH